MGTVGICSLCGAEKKLISQYGEGVCSMCQIVRIAANKRPDDVIKSLRKFGNFPDSGGNGGASELQDTLDFVRKDLEKSIELNQMQKKEVDELTRQLDVSKTANGVLREKIMEHEKVIELMKDELRGDVVCEKTCGDLVVVQENCQVNHPRHYTQHPSGVECIQITEHMGFNLGNVIKYVWRADLKDDAIKDMQKALFYINREISRRTR